MVMTNKHVKAVIQLRRATEREWIDKNPVLRNGEPALSTDVYMLKMGDGNHTWRQLPYITNPTGEGKQYTAGNGIIIEGTEIELDDLILNCGTSTTVV